MPDWLTVVGAGLGCALYDRVVGPFLRSRWPRKMQVWTCPGCGARVEFTGSDPALVVQQLDALHAPHRPPR